MKAENIQHDADMRTALLKQDEIAKRLKAEAAQKEEWLRILNNRDKWTLDHGGVSNPDNRGPH